MTIGVLPDIQERIRTLGLLDPTDRRKMEPRRAALGLDTLLGMKAGFLDNRKGNADAILEWVREVLEREYQVVTAVSQAKWVFSAPAAPEIVDELARCDFVVTAIGD